MERDALKPGRYRHYKGREYWVLGVARHSETLEDMVVYEALYDNELSKLWVRPLAMFVEHVDSPELHYKGPRFVYVGE